MTFRVHVFVVVLCAVGITAFPFRVFLKLGRLDSLDQLVDELEPLELERHNALADASKKLSFKNNERMVKFLTTWSEYDTRLAEARTLFTEISRYLKIGKESEARKLYPDAQKLNQQLRFLNKKLAEERKTIPSDLLEEPEYRRIETAFRVNARKVIEIVNTMQHALQPLLIESVKRRKITFAEFGVYL